MSPVEVKSREKTKKRNRRKRRRHHAALENESIARKNYNYFVFEAPKQAQVPLGIYLTTFRELSLKLSMPYDDVHVAHDLQPSFLLFFFKLKKATDAVLWHRADDTTCVVTADDFRWGIVSAPGIPTRLADDTLAARVMSKVLLFSLSLSSQSTNAFFRTNAEPLSFRHRR